MLDYTRARSRRVRRRLTVPLVLLALLIVTAQVAGVRLLVGRAPRASASPSISQIYFTPYEAQEYIGILRAIAGNPGCCSGPVLSTISITSGEDGNTVVYDHFEDGYEIDPFDAAQVSTTTLSLDAGQVWTQTSSVPVDQPGRGAGFYYDGRDKIVSSGPVAVTDTAYAATPGSLHAGAVEVLDVDKSGTAFDIPVGEDADYNSVFEYVGLVVVANQAGTTVQVDADADGSAETVAPLGEGETLVVPGGVNLGARVTADRPVAVYVLTGDIGATYEGRDFELYPTEEWSDQLVSPVAARSTAAADGTRVFLYNPSATPVVVDVETGLGPAGSLNLAAHGQASFLMPVDEGARFTARNGAPIYGFQAVTTEVDAGDSTASYDWGFSLIPVSAATTSVIVPYAPGSEGLTNNYSPVWVVAFASTTLYVDRDGDPTTGIGLDPNGDRYDFTCAAASLRTYTIYDDGTANCYLPSQDSAAGGDRDMTGARIYTVDDTRVVSAWGQRSSYVAGSPGLDVGTTILPFPAIRMAKSSAVVGDVDGDGLADPGDTVEYTITMTNWGIVSVGSVVLTDEVPDDTGYLADSTNLDGVPQADDSPPASPPPFDADSPGGGLVVGTIGAGATRTATLRVVVDDPLPFGVGSVLNLATMTTQFGTASAANLLPLDAGLRIDKAADPGPVEPGDPIAYTVRVFNGERLEETGVSLVDTLPAGTTYVAGSAAATLDGVPVAVGDPPDLVSALSMPPGSVLTVTFSVTADDPMAEGLTEFVNLAAASSDQTPVPVTAEATTAATPGPDPVVAKVPSVGSVPEPGSTVTFTVEVEDAGGEEMTLTALADDVFGDLLDAGNPAVTANTCPAQPLTIPVGGTFFCSFDAYLSGGPADPAHTDTVTAVAVNAVGRTGSGSDGALVSFGDVPPSLAAAKTPSVGSVPEPGATVTFDVEVANTSVEQVTLTALADDVFGDLLDGGNPAVTANTCPAQPLTIPVGGTFSCSFDALVEGGFGDPDHTDTVTATAEDDEGNSAVDGDGAAVAFGDVSPTIDLAKGAAPGSVPEPGGIVTFEVEVANTSVEQVTLTALADDVFGDLLDGGNPAVTANTCPAQPLTIPVGGTFSCSFDALVEGGFGDPDHTDTVTATVEDDEGNPAESTDGASVSFGDVLPSLAAAKTPSVGSVPEPGGTVTFDVEVANTSVEQVTLTALADDVFGDLLDGGNPAVTANTCPAQAPVIPVGGTFSCSFDAHLYGGPADPAHTDTVTATAEDDDGNPASAADEATVAFGDASPSLGVAKVPSASAVAEPGGIVTFDVEVASTSVEAVTLTALADDVFGDLLDAGNPAVTANTCPARPLTIPVGGTFSCSFNALVEGDSEGPPHADTVTATVEEDEGNAASAWDAVEVAFIDTDAAVRGHLFVDLDGDGRQGGAEADLAGVAVEVTDLTGSPVTVSSGDDGDWEAAVRAGPVAMQVVEATVPPGYQLTTANASQEVAPVAGTSAATADVGYQPRAASLLGAVFFDVNGDGGLDPAEPVFAGVRVDLYDAGGLVETTLTGGTGAYQFTGLPAGAQRIVVHDGTAQFLGFEATADPDGDADGETSLGLAAGETRSGLDFAYRGTGRVGDTVWNDTDGDGAQDGGEGPLPGVVLGLVWGGFDRDMGTGDDVAFPDESTDSHGNYWFSGVPPGPVATAVDLSSVAGDMEATTDTDFEVVLAPGEAYLEGDMGFRSEGSLPNTGFDAGPLSLLALGLVLAGILVLAGTRRAEQRDRCYRIPWHRLQGGAQTGIMRPPAKK